MAQTPERRGPGPIPLFTDHVFTSDPAAHVIGDRVWLFTTHDPVSDRNPMDQGIFLKMYDYRSFSSDNLVDWVDHGSYLSRKDVDPRLLDGYCWHHGAWDGDAGVAANGKYYAYFTIGDRIFVAVADRPEGPYAEARGAALISRDTPGIPPYDRDALLVSSCVLADGGAHYLYFGQRHLYAAKLKPNMIELAENPRRLASPPDFVEDVWITKIGARYYWTYADGWDAHTSAIQYATSPGPYGPFTNRGALIKGFAKGCTNQTAIVNHQGKWYVFYMLAGPDPFHRRVALAELQVEADGSLRAIDPETDPGAGGGAYTLVLDAFAPRREAEEYHDGHGVRIAEGEGCDWHVVAGDRGWIRFRDMDFGAGAAGFAAEVAHGGDAPATMALRLDGPEGPVIGTCAVAPTGGWDRWRQAECALGPGVAGKHDLYLAFAGAGADDLFRLNRFTFRRA